MATIEQLQQYPMDCDNAVDIQTKEGIRFLNSCYNDELNIRLEAVCRMELKPHLRSLSQLTQEIVHEGYNDGKPFVPIVELAKRFAQYGKEKQLPIQEYIQSEDIFKTYQVQCHLKKGLILFRVEKDLKGSYPLEMFQQLLQWHFAIGIDKADYIEKK